MWVKGNSSMFIQELSFHGTWLRTSFFLVKELSDCFQDSHISIPLILSEEHTVTGQHSRSQSLDCGRNLEKLEETHAGMRTTCKTTIYFSISSLFSFQNTVFFSQLILRLSYLHKSCWFQRLSFDQPEAYELLVRLVRIFSYGETVFNQKQQLGHVAGSLAS